MKCWICDWNYTTIEHHIIRRSDNGINTKKNKIILCQTCHDLIHKGFHNLTIDELSNLWFGIINGDIRQYKIFFLHLAIIIGAVKGVKKNTVKEFLRKINSIPNKLELVKIRKIKRRG